MTGPSDSVPMPCPFCGGVPEFENTDERARLRCTSCGTEGGLFFFSPEECESGLSDETEAKAIAAWNRRAALPVAPSDEPHPPSRHCMCAACRPSFDDDAPLPVAALSDADRELIDALNGLSQVRKSLHEANEAGLIGDVLWVGPSETTFDALDAAIDGIDALRTRLLRHSEGKEPSPIPTESQPGETP